MTQNVFAEIDAARILQAGGYLRHRDGREGVGDRVEEHAPHAQQEVRTHSVLIYESEFQYHRLNI